MDSLPMKTKKTERESGLKWVMRKHTLAIEILELLNRQVPERKHVVREMVDKIRAAAAIDAVGIRLHEDGVLPFFVTSGFSEHFVHPENRLNHGFKGEPFARDSKGIPALRCICGKVLQARTEPPLSFKSPGGSFWTNHMSDLLDSCPAARDGSIGSGPCGAEGYESVALVPIRCTDEILGLLQLNDRREGCFSPEIIRFFESLATSIGVVLERMTSSSALAKANEELEIRAQERTSELVKINDHLRIQIAERERIEEALQKSETRYRTLVETAREIIWTVGVEGQYTYISPSVTRVLGYTPEEIMRLNPLETLTPGTRERLLRVFIEELSPQETKSVPPTSSRTFEVEQQCKDGSTVWMEITATALRGPDGTLDGMLGVSREISERKQIEEMKTEFMTVAAHELQTPLTSIIGYSELLLIRDDFTVEERQDCLRRIHAQAGNLAALVSRLLGIWNETGSTLPAKAEPWPVQEFVEHLVDSYRARFPAHQFETLFSPCAATLTITQQTMTEILLNVLNNATQYSPTGGLIRVTCKRVGDRCLFSIEDQGIGMTPEQVPRIFDRFYRADTSNTALSGLGLGMSHVKNLVEASGGQVWVESAYGKGTTVCFSLPCGLADPSEGGPHSEENTHRG